MYALRTDQDFAVVKTWVETRGYAGFAVRELVDGGNEHWHWLLTTDEKISVVRTSFNRACPTLKGNGAYSLSVVKDVDKYERYMAKGDSEGVAPEVCWRYGLRYSDEKLEELHEAYWTENRKLKKRKTGSVIDNVIDICKAQNVNWERRDKIGEIYIKQLVERSRPINLFAVKSSVNLIQVKLCPDDKAIDELVGRFIVT